jgi:hypothetical protein
MKTRVMSFVFGIIIFMWAWTSFAVVSGNNNLDVITDRNAKPLLVKTLGGLAHLGQTNTCEIYANNPQIKHKLNDVIKTINLAQKNSELETVAVFIMAQVPSIEIHANRIITVDGDKTPTQIEKVELENIYSTHKARTSAEAQALIALVNEICP